MTIDIMEVPLDVLEKVLKKWRGALESGWYPKLWTSCELCKYMAKVQNTTIADLDCTECPLYSIIFGILLVADVDAAIRW